MTCHPGALGLFSKHTKKQTLEAEKLDVNIGKFWKRLLNR